MKRSELFSNGWCELVFERRNRSYGAYVMRAQTGHRFGIAIITVCALFLLFAVPSFIMELLHRRYAPVKRPDPVENIVRFEGVRLKEARPVRRPAEKVEPQLTVRADEEEIIQIPDKEKLAVAFHPDDFSFVPEDIKDLPVDSSHLLRQEEHLLLARDTEQTDGIILDSIPHYPTGIAAFMRWLQRTMIYPPECVRRHEEGTVEVAFIVEPSGQIADVRILRGATAALNHEAMRVMAMMPKWLPAQKNGRPIRAQVTLPIVFEID